MTRLHRSIGWMTCTVFAGTLMYQPPALAQLEEIIVTARKRE
jgi:hypothetical protein